MSDDVTMAGIAAALGTTLKRDPTLEVLFALKPSKTNMR
jgi:hypothetical protein